MATRQASLVRRALLQRQGHRFAGDQRGATLVEFGLLALPFFSIIGAILETSVVFLSSQVLDSAVQDVSRLVRTGQAHQASLDLDDFRTRVCDRVYGLFNNCNTNLHVEVQSVTDFAAASISAPIDWSCETSTCGWTRAESYAPGQGSSVVVVQVYYKWPVMLSLGDFSLANLPGNQRLLSAATVFRNEPFSGG